MSGFKSFLWLVAVGVAFSVIMAGCGTNEANYKKAYDKAQEKGADGIESTIYNRIRERKQEERIVTEGDTVAVVSEYVTAVKEAGFDAGDLHKYNVVVGQFKQLFHAKSMRGRMASAGYDGAIIVATGEPLYYVVALSSESLVEVKAVADSLAKSSPVKLGEGFPWILRAANRR